ncbi:MAG: hypothetical protein U5N55_11690 [Cypionkella sp.]|nr:hypothetical protein [Cypionkella sp.]
MTQLIIWTLSAICIAGFGLVYFFFIPRMRKNYGWHIQGLSMLGFFSGYLALELLAPTTFFEQYRWIYFIGNGSFAVGLLLVTGGYIYQYGWKGRKQ